MTGMMPIFSQNNASAATMPMTAAGISNVPPNPPGHSTWYPKNSARLTMTPTTAAVIAVSGAVNDSSPCVDSINGPPARMNRNDGRNVKNVTMAAAKAPDQNNESPTTRRVQPPTKPTKATTMISGPGVVSPS